MKSKSICIILLLLVMMVYPSAKAAIWNPDNPNDLSLNVNFEINANGPPPTTTDAGKYSIVGTATDYNTTDPFHMWNSQWNGDANAVKIGNYVGDFRKPCDVNTTKAGDCRVKMPHPAGDLRIYDLGGTGEYLDIQRTFAFWFYCDSQAASGTFIRHEDPDPNYAVDYWWEVKILDGKLQFLHKQNVLRFETKKLLADLGVQPNTWHHAVLVYDRSAREASQIYVDGVQVDKVVTSYDAAVSAEVDPIYTSPLVIGAGDTDFDGMLDEVRIYNKKLEPNQVSILYQIDYTVKPFALNPFPNAGNVAVTTTLSWEPIAGVTTQELFLDTNDVNMASRKTGNGAMNSATNGEIGGPLALATTYYWAVDSNAGQFKGPIWKFTTEDGNAFNPYPADDGEDVNIGSVNLQWTGSPSAVSYDVYFSDNPAFVADMCALALVADPNIYDTNAAVSAPVRGETYYWRVVSNLAPALGYPPAVGDIWEFRTEPKLIIVNTSDANAGYLSVNYPAKTITFVEDSCVVNGYLGDDDTVIFDFGSLTINELYSIVVIPLFDNTVEADMNNRIPSLRKTSRPMAIHANGDVDLNCKIVASAPDSTTTQGPPSSQARSGGHRGSYREEDRTALNPIEIFGLGYGATGYTGSSPCGAGGGYGGKGGDQARAGGGSGGDAYGYEKIPVPIGGSAGGFGNGAGAGGGGAVEIAATGNITFGSEMRFLVTGGKAPSLTYPAGGGSGGSVKIIAGGNFTNNGIIDANGGKGGDATQADEPKNPGGGGGGGRVAIFHAGSYTNNGSINVAGGAVGRDADGETSSQPGASGTVIDYDNNLGKPDYPTPADDSDYVGTSNQVTLKWYPGFGDTQNKVYFGIDPNVLSLIDTISGVPANGGVLRAEQSCANDVNIGQTYYWYVEAATSAGDVNSDLWSFTVVNDFKLVFNTSDVNTVKYEDVNIAPLTCREKNETGWVTTPVATGSVDANCNVAVFNFAGGFDYNKDYTIAVVPDYTCTGKSSTYEEPALSTRRPLSIHVTGDFFFDGGMNISGDNVLLANDRPKARSGGFRGMRKKSSALPDFDDLQEFDAGYLSRVTSGIRYHRYQRDPGTSIRDYYVLTATGYDVFGLGAGSNIIGGLETGSGGGYGGYGGDCGRNYYYGLFGGGYPYGDKEVPVPFGGSSGAYGKELGGGAGGGGVEIIATGNVTFGPNAEIYSEGGSVLTTIARYTGGGGAGGSVKVIAGGNFTNNGIIDVNGGKGGSLNNPQADTGGGGAGGRVSVFYGGTYTNTGPTTANGGAKGIIEMANPSDPNYHTSISENGQNGTIFFAPYSNSSPTCRKASAPTPRNGDKLVYASSSPTAITLKWYSGYNVTSANDIVYLREGSAPTDTVTYQIGAPVPAIRGQHSSTVDASVLPNKTYYFKVRTKSADSNVSDVNSDVWSFKTVGWQCKAPYDTTDPNNYQPQWDMFPNDCVVNFKDYMEFAEDWRNPAFGGNFMLDLPELYVFIEEWIECQGRTDSGCSGW